MSQPFLNEDAVTKSTSIFEFFRRVAPYLKRHKYLTIGVIFIVVFQAIISRLLPSVIGWTVDYGILKKDTAFVTLMAFSYLGLEVLKSSLSFANIYFFQKLGNRVLYYLREDLTRHILNLPVQFFNQTPTGRIVTRMTNDISTLGELFSDGIVSVITNAVMLVAIVAFMAAINWKLTLATLILTPLFIYTSLKLGKKIRGILTESKKKLAALNSFVAENLNGIKVVQLYGKTSAHSKRFLNLSTDYKNNTLQSIHYNAMLHPLMHLFGSVTVAATLYYGGLLRLDNSIEIGSLIAFFLHVQDFIHPLREIVDKYQQFQNSLTSADRIFTILDVEPENLSGISLAQPEIKGNLRIQNLNFSYNNKDLILKNLNLNIPQGRTVALVGKTGSGKTTLISLLQRFYEPPANSIFLDDIPIESIDRLALRRYICSVQQDPFLFKGSIAANISLDDESLNPQQIQKVAEQVGLTSLLLKSQRNLNSPVEEKGANLSLGERQLISFARIMAFNPQVIILDEATANVDSETEAALQLAMQKVTVNRTSIIIAHRLSTIERADQIVVLNQGQVMETGSHSELLERKGVYYKLHTSGGSEENQGLVSSGV